MSRRLSLTVLSTLALSSLALAQESRATFDAPLVELGSLNRIEHLVELDGTPGPEALSWWWQDKGKDDIHVRGWDIDPQTGFEQLWQLPVSNPGAPLSGGWITLVPAAIDGAAADDLIVATNRYLYFYRGGRTGAPVLNQTFSFATTYVTEAFAADFDGDGDDDLVTIDIGLTATLFENSGAANGWVFNKLPTTQYLGSLKSRIRFAELTGDNTPDLFFVRDDAIVIQPIDPQLAFPAEIAFPIVSAYYQPNPTVGDIDGDGDDDAVVFAVDSTTMAGVYTVLRRDGPSSFIHEAPALGGPATDLVDLDGDGDLDGACCGGGGGGAGPPSSPYGWHNTLAATFQLCHNDGSGGFTPSFQMLGLGATRLAGATDIDLDGDVDLVAGRVVYYSDGGINAPFETMLGYGEHHSKLLRDWDGEGDPDLRAGYEEVRRSDATGHFESMAPEMKAPTVSGLTFKGPGYVGDFDGDGHDDLLVAKYKDGTFRRMRLLTNTGGGQLQDAGDASDPAVSFSKTGNDYIDPRGGWAIDIEPDGDLDLITWAPWATAPDGSLWINDGSGYFQESTQLDLSSYRPQGAGDFNGDQFRDLLLTLYNDSLVIFLGDGSGGGSGVAYPGTTTRVNGELGAIAVGDFDDDGDRDIVYCDQSYSSSGRVLMFVNDGQANFAEVDLGLAGPFYLQRPGLAVTSDVNGDGWSDVIVSGLDSGKTAAAILLRNPDGVGFQSPFEQIVRPYQAKDIDGDGDQDLVDGSFDNQISIDDRIVKNRRVEGESAGWRRQDGYGVAGTGDFTPNLGAKMFGGYSIGDGIKYKVTGAAPGITGRLVITELSTAAAAPYKVTGNTVGTLPSDRAVGKFTQVIDFVTSGAPSDPPGTGAWDTRHLINWTVAGRTFMHRVELDDPSAPNGLARTNDLTVRYAD